MIPTARLIVLGYNNASIARTLNIKPRTVENYIRILFYHYGMTGKFDTRVKLAIAIKDDLTAGVLPNSDKLSRIIKDFEFILRDFINSSYEV